MERENEETEVTGCEKWREKEETGVTGCEKWREKEETGVTGCELQAAQSIVPCGEMRCRKLTWCN